MALAASTTIRSVAAIPKVSVTGAKFFTDDGNQFYLKGVFTHLIVGKTTAIDLPLE